MMSVILSWKTERKTGGTGEKLLLAGGKVMRIFIVGRRERERERKEVE